MIGFLKGHLIRRDLKGALLDVGGVGYRLRMPLSDLARLGSPNDGVEVHVHTHVREDAIELFAFLHEDALILFEKLLTVSKIGPKLALAILSGLPPNVLRASVMRKDATSLTAIPGIGEKTAERIVLELHDKMADSTTSPGKTAKNLAGNSASVTDDDPMAWRTDLVSALINLGFRNQDAVAAVEAVAIKASPGTTLEALVRDALSYLA